MKILFILFALIALPGCLTIGVDYPIGHGVTVSARTNLKTLELNLNRR